VSPNFVPPPADRDEEAENGTWTCDECGSNYRTHAAAKQCEEDDKDARLRTS
jgi:hypothetical protein